MTLKGMHTETVSWLCGQLRELDHWRVELAEQGDGDVIGLERIEAQRNWLEQQIGALDLSQTTPPALN